MHQSKHAIPPMPSMSTPGPVNWKKMLSPPPKFGPMTMVALTTAVDRVRVRAGPADREDSTAQISGRYLIISPFMGKERSQL